MPQPTKCPGCGQNFTETDGPTHKYLSASAGCWAMYTEVLAREYSDFSYFKVHRLTVDAYALQHPGIPSPQTIQSAALHAISLYLCFEKKNTGNEATKAMQQAAKRKELFSWLAPPSADCSVTIKEVHAATSAKEHVEVVTEWARSVWQSWSKHQVQVESWLKEMGL